MASDNQSSELVPKVAVTALSNPLEVGAERAPAAAADLAALLTQAGCDVVQLDAISTPDGAVAAGRQLAEAHVDAVVLALPCWCEDYLALDVLEECNVPLLLWSLPGMQTGSLCGAQQLSCFLKQLEVAYDAVFGPIEPDGPFARGQCFLRAAALKNRMRRARIGLAGHRVAGMTHTSPNEFMLKKVIGPRIVPLDLPELLAQIEQMPLQQARQQWQRFKQSSGCCRASDEDGVDALRVYAALKEVIRRKGLHALTVGCYPHLMGRVCIAASLLGDDGIALACEGDVHGAIGQMMLMLLTGGPTHNTDWLEPMEDGSVVFTHCGSGSLSLAERPADITLAPVRLMEQGVCAMFPARPGPVTLIGLVPHARGYQCALLEGTAVSTDMVFPGNPVRVRFEQPTSVIIEWIHDQGIGHHWMVGYGRVAAEFRAWAKMLGPSLRLLEP